MSATRPTPDVAVIGCGAVGRRVVRHVVSAGVAHIAVHDLVTGVADRLAQGAGPSVSSVDLATALTARVVVFAHPGDQASGAREVLEARRSCVSVVDDLDEYRRLSDLGALANARETTLVVGAGMSPGISGLLARHLAARLDEIDEIHVAVHGTGGPACARQHHDALGGTALVWHDNEWLDAPAGSGRELCWFPDPVGAHDCYRAELADPLVLHDAFPFARRVSARMSATRRDRLTARLPMLRPPHPDGGIGGVRVEVRGSLGGTRQAMVAGVAERPSIAAGVMAGVFAIAVLDEMVPVGRIQPGREELPTSLLIERLRAAGLRPQEFVGIGA